VTPPEVIAVLSVTPHRIGTLSADLSADRLLMAPAPGEWSVNELLAHLRANADVWGGHIDRILREDRPTWRRVSPRAWLRKTDYATWPFPASLEAFATQRADLLAVLEPLTPASWERIAVVRESSGRVVERSVIFYATSLADHEHEHLAQMAVTIRAVTAG
jgi:hypothetical protein